MITIKEVNENDLKAFREYWQEQAVGSGKLPIVGNKVYRIKLGREDDLELYRKFSKYMEELILFGFKIAPHDLSLDTSLSS